MNTQEFRRQIKEAGLEARKQRDLEVFDVRQNGTTLFSIWYADIFSLTDISPLLEKRLRPKKWNEFPKGV